MAKEGTRRVVERILTTLNAASGFLATELTAQESDWGHAAGYLPLPADRDMLVGDLMEIPPPQNFPTIYVIPRGWRPSNLLHGFKDLVHSIDVQVYMAFSDNLTLQRKLWLYARAVERVLEDRVRTGDEVWRIEWQGASYSPVAYWKAQGSLVQGIGMLGQFWERVTRPSSV